MLVLYFLWVSSTSVCASTPSMKTFDAKSIKKAFWPIVNIPFQFQTWTQIIFAQLWELGNGLRNCNIFLKFTDFSLQHSFRIAGKVPHPVRTQKLDDCFREIQHLDNVIHFYCSSRTIPWRCFYRPFIPRLSFMIPQWFGTHYTKEWAATISKFGFQAKYTFRFTNRNILLSFMAYLHTK